MGTSKAKRASKQPAKWAIAGPAVRGAAATYARGIAVGRSREAVEVVVQHLSRAQLERISRPEATRFDVLVTLAQSEAARSGDALGAARLRGIEAQRRLMERAGPLLPATVVAKLVGVSPAAIHQRYKKHQLLAVSQGRKLAYPMVQFERGEVLEGLPEVLKALASNEVDPWSQLRFLVGQSTRLGGRTPIEELRAGRGEEVLRAARTFGEHGAA